jgi:hypothetical protein
LVELSRSTSMTAPKGRESRSVGGRSPGTVYTHQVLAIAAISKLRVIPADTQPVTTSFPSAGGSVTARSEDEISLDDRAPGF